MSGTQERAERLNKLCSTLAVIDADVARDAVERVFDVLPAVNDAVWTRFLKLVEAEPKVPTRVRFERLMREAGEYVRRNKRSPVRLPQQEPDVAYGRDRLMLIEMVVRGDLQPELVAERLRRLVDRHPEHATSLAKEIAVLERNPTDWRAVLAELTGGEKRVG